MKIRTSLLLSLLVLAGSFQAPAGLFGPKGKTDKEKRQTVRQQRDEMLAELFKSQPQLKERLKKAAGYATFKQSDVNLFLLASGQGYGLLVDNKTGKETFMRVASLGGGVGFGIKDLRVVFIFNDPKVMRSFVEQGWQFGGKADAAAKYQDTGISAEQSVKADVDFKEGTVASGSSTDARAGLEAKDAQSQSVALGGAMEIYQFTQSGVSLQATVAGTKYWKDKKLTP
jgi:lipid-binding SYLF domain-containing protein